jgi:regulator of protease activity HflC (stomatin/prohibitin superfamily)
MGIQEIIGGLATLAWLGVIGMLGWVVFSAARGRRVGGGGLWVGVIAVLAAVLTTAAGGVVFIEQNERGVVLSALSPTGRRDEVLQPGLRWIVPFAERVERYSIAFETYTMSSTQNEGQVSGDDSVQVRTKDGQQIFIDASIIYAPDENKIINLHIKWQKRYPADLVRTQSRGIIRDVASQYGVEEIVSSKRVEMEQAITEALTRVFSENSLELSDFVLRNIRFSDEYAAAVEQKQIAEQQAQQARFVVEQKKQEAEQARQVAQGQADAKVIAAKGEAEARIIQAQAEAEALKQINAALEGNPDLLTYQYIQKIAPGVQTIYLPSNQPFLIPLPQSGGGNGAAITPTQPISPTTP